MNTGTPDGFSRLCSLMRDVRVGHIEELLKYNFEQEINYKTSDVALEVTKKYLFFIKIFSGEDTHHRRCWKCFGYHTDAIFRLLFLNWTGKLCEPAITSYM